MKPWKIIPIIGLVLLLIFSISKINNNLKLSGTYEKELITFSKESSDARNYELELIETIKFIKNIEKIWEEDNVKKRNIFLTIENYTYTLDNHRKSENYLRWKKGEELRIKENQKEKAFYSEATGKIIFYLIFSGIFFLFICIVLAISKAPLKSNNQKEK